MGAVHATRDRGEQHQQLLERYQDLLRKYRYAVERRAHGGTLSEWLLRHSADGAVLLEGSRILASNRRFLQWSAAHPDWCEVEGAKAHQPQTLIGIVSRSVEPSSTPEDSAPLRIRPLHAPGPVLELRLHPVEECGAGRRVIVLLHDVSEQEEWRREREASGVRDRFLGTLAHELRNPLAAITNAAHLLQASSDAKTRNAAEVILRQSRAQSRMIEDLLDVARVREGKLQLQSELLDLCQVLREAIEATEPQRQLGPRLEVRLPEGDVPVTGDATRLVQVVSNLLVNAAKFTPREGVNGIELGMGEGIAWVRVWDTGHGIPEEALLHVWEPFFQQHSDHTARSGLGIGLALVKTLVEQHRGGVRAASEGPGRGAEFTLWLPLCERPAPVPADRPLRPLVRPLRILILENDAASREALMELLVTRGHQVSAPDSATAAIGRILQERPEGILCALRHPELEGLSVARAARSLLPEARFVAIGGDVPAELQQQAREAGFDACLQQPFDLERLLAELEGSGRN